MVTRLSPGSSSQALVQGEVHPRWRRLELVFRRQVAATSGGAALCVIHRGKVVADLWGGRRTDEEPWQRDTVAMCFSTTKGVVSAALHVLADRGLVDYDAPVAEYWPEFAQAGKQDVLVRHLLTHSAGLHRIRTVIDHASQMLDWEVMVERLAAAEPAYAPGTKHGYHGLTYGWLVGEVIRRVTGRTVQEVVADELAGPLGLDGLHVGCPPAARHRVAPLQPLSIAGMTGLERVLESRAGRLPSLLRTPANPRRLLNVFSPRGVEEVLWGPEVMDVAIPAANGFFDARSLARLYAALGTPGGPDLPPLVSADTRDLMRRTQVRGRDLVLVVPMHWRLGFHRAFTSRGSLPGAYGHFGLGGSGAWVDPRRELAVAMVCNRGSGTPIGDVRIMQLGTAAAADADDRP